MHVQIVRLRNVRKVRWRTFVGVRKIVREFAGVEKEFRVQRMEVVAVQIAWADVKMEVRTSAWRARKKQSEFIRI